LGDNAAEEAPMNRWKVVAPAVVLGAGMMFWVSSSYGTQEYAKKEKKSCTYCHGKMVADKAEMNKNLNTAGTCYKDNDHSLAKCEAPKK
jgi:hypothetical protein